MIDNEYLGQKAILVAASINEGVWYKEAIWALLWLIPAIPQTSGFFRARVNEYKSIKRYLVFNAAT